MFQAFDVPVSEAGWTEEKFVETAKRLTKDTDRDGVIDVFGFCMTTLLNRWPMLGLQYGVDFGALARDPEPLIRTLRLIRDMAYHDRCALLLPAGGLGRHPFFYEKAAMTLTSSIELGAWRNQNIGFAPKVAKLEFGTSGSTTLTATFALIPDNAPRKELALSFLRAALDEQVQADISTACGSFSVLPPVNAKQPDDSFAKAIRSFESEEQSSYFLHELFPAPGVMFELEAEMDLFWIGLERAEPVAERIGRLLRAGAERPNGSAKSTTKIIHA